MKHKLHSDRENIQQQWRKKGLSDAQVVLREGSEKARVNSPARLDVSPVSSQMNRLLTVNMATGLRGPWL